MSDKTAPVVLFRDERVALEQNDADRVALVINKSGSLYTPFNTSFLSYSTSSCNITIQTSGVKMMLSRDIRARFKFQFVITDPAPDAKFSPLYSCPQAFPLNSSIQTLALSINGSTTTQNNAQLLQALLRYNNTENWRAGAGSTTPAMLDYYSEYKDQFGVAGVAGTGGLLYSPFAPSGATVEPSRAGFGPQGSIFSNVSEDGKTMTIEVCELLMISPLTTERNATALSNVSYLQVQLTFMPRLAQYFLSQINEGNPNAFDVNSVVASIVEPPTLIYSQITPSASQMEKIPVVLNYPYSRYFAQENPNIVLQPYGTNGDTIQQLQATPIRITSIPNYIYVYVSNVNYNNKLMTDSYSYCQISNVQVLFNNSSSLLANSSIYDLYAMSKENGYVKDFTSWAYRNGSVLRISFDTDIQQPDLLASGCSAQTTLNISCTVRNLSSKAISGVLTTITQLNGLCSISPNMTQFVQSTITSDDVKRAEDSPDSHKFINDHNVRNKNDVLGGAKKHFLRQHKGGASIGGESMGGSNAVVEESKLRLGGNKRGDNQHLPKFMRS